MLGGMYVDHCGLEVCLLEVPFGLVLVQETPRSVNWARMALCGLPPIPGVALRIDPQSGVNMD